MQAHNDRRHGIPDTAVPLIYKYIIRFAARIMHVLCMFERIAARFTAVTLRSETR